MQRQDQIVGYRKTKSLSASMTCRHLGPESIEKEIGQLLQVRPKDINDEIGQLNFFITRLDG
jgi:hypothetical protein